MRRCLLQQRATLHPIRLTASIDQLLCNGSGPLILEGDSDLGPPNPKERENLVSLCQREQPGLGLPNMKELDLRLPMQKKEIQEAIKTDLGLLCQKGDLQEAIEAAEDMYLQGYLVSKDSFYTLLQCCNKVLDMERGRKVLSLMVRCRLEASAFLGYHVICLFSSCGNLLEAYKMFTMIAKPNVYTFHSIILACIRFGDHTKALELYMNMRKVGVNPDKFVFSSILSCCSNNFGAMKKGMIIHDHIVRYDIYKDLIVANALIDMYSKCRCLDEAYKVFDEMPTRDIVSWSSLICGYANHECGSSAIAIYNEMEGEGIYPNKVTFLSILKACGHMNENEKGRSIHDQIVKGGNDVDVCVSSALVYMYTKCGSLDEAWRVFEKSTNQDVISWGTMISALSQNWDSQMALELFEGLMKKQIEPDITCFSSALKSCGRLGALRQGRLIHTEIFNRKLDGSVVVGGALVDMYVNCGSLEDAVKVFQEHSDRDVVLYGAMISGCVECGHGSWALRLYVEMRDQYVNPNKFIYSCVLKACSSVTAQKEGELIHDHVIRTGLEAELIVGSAIVDMYTKCSRLLEGCKVFEDLHERDLVSWAAMIVGHAQSEQGYLAFEYFEKMQHEGIGPDACVYSGMLKACGSMSDMNVGRYVHGKIIEDGCDLDEVIGNSLVDMYVKCGNLDEALQIFERMPCRNLEAWTSIISGYIGHGHGSFALHLLSLMQLENVEPDKLLFLLILRACWSIEALLKGKIIHFLIIHSGHIVDATLGNSLLDLYCKCGKLDDARSIFDRLQTRDVFSWGSLVTGFAHHDHWVTALGLFEGMCEEGIEPNQSTLLSLLKACGSVGAIRQTVLIHEQILRRGLESDILLATTLLDTYAKCGNIEEAQKVFEKLSEKDLVSWGALVAGYAQHGNDKMVEKCLRTLQMQGLKPNDVIFTSLLAACSKVGFLGKGCSYFKSMMDVYGIFPCIEQYSCMVDLFGRHGCLYEAEGILHTMPMPPDFVLWTSLLNSSDRYGDLGLGSVCFDELIKSIPLFDGSSYVFMANLYVDAQVFEDESTKEDIDNVREHAEFAAPFFPCGTFQ